MLDSLVGVVPAAGVARRLGSPAGSKELERVYVDPARDGEPRPVVYRLLHAMAASGVAGAYVVTSASKNDVRDVLGAGGDDTPALEHLVVESSPGAAWTISIGTAAAGDRPVALGFPDVLWAGDRAFSRLAEALAETDADIAIGTFPPAPDYPTDGVHVAGDGTVLGFEPADTAEGVPTWTLAVWRASFSRLLEREVALRYGPWTAATKRGELSMTSVLALTLEAGLSIVGVEVSDRPFIDIGDPARLAAARAACARGSAPA